MAKTTEEALNELRRLKERRNAVLPQDSISWSFWNGMITGAANAYWASDVISFEQYTEVLDTAQAEVAHA